MPVQIQQRRDTAANWTTANPTLALGEVGWETDTRLSKLGDGSTAWNSLPYTVGGVSDFTDLGDVPGSYTGQGSKLVGVKATEDGLEFVSDGAGTVTIVGSGTGLTGGPITGSGTLSLANTAVTPGSYTNTNLTVDAQGRITAASNGSGGGMTNPMTTAGDIIIGGASGTPTRLAAGTNAYVLTMVAGAPAWAAAGGGGGLTNFTEGVNSSSPNATVPVVYLNATNAATNVDIAICPKGTGAFSLQIADGTSTGGNKRGAYAVDFQRVRASASQVASGQYSFLQGQNSTAAGAHSVAIGQDLTVTGGGSVALGGRYTNISGTGCFAAAGQFTQLSANYSMGSGQYSIDRGIDTSRVISGGCFASNGDAQAQELVLRRGTTDATPGRMTASISTGGTNAAAAANQLVLENNSCYAVKAVVVVRQDATGDSAKYDVDFCIKRGANAASTALVGTATATQVQADAGASTWTVGVTADTTIGCPAFTVTGEAAHTLRWSAHIYACVQVVG